MGVRGGRLHPGILAPLVLFLSICGTYVFPYSSPSAWAARLREQMVEEVRSRPRMPRSARMDYHRAAEGYGSIST